MAIAKVKTKVSTDAEMLIKLSKDLDVTQVQLAALTGLSQSQFTRWMEQDRSKRIDNVGFLPALCFAGLATGDDRQYWLDRAGYPSIQTELLEKALSTGTNSDQDVGPSARLGTLSLKQKTLLARLATMFSEGQEIVTQIRVEPRAQGTTTDGKTGRAVRIAREKASSIKPDSNRLQRNNRASSAEPGSASGGGASNG